MHKYLLATDLAEKVATISRDLKQNLNVVNEEVHNIRSVTGLFISFSTKAATVMFINKLMPTVQFNFHLSFKDC